MGSKLIEIRLPSEEEKARGADVVFERRAGSEEHTILASVCHESWEQWGAIREILSDNCDTVEAWRRGEFPGFEPPVDQD